MSASRHLFSRDMALSLGAGVLVAIQARMNGGLSERLGSALIAALISFGSGLAILTFAMFLWRPMWDGVSRLSECVRQGVLSRWQLFAGLAGAIFVWAQSSIVPVVGTSVFLVGVTAGISGGSLLVDRLGLSAIGKQAVTWSRVGAAVLAVFAVGVAVIGQAGGFADLGALAVIALAVGVLNAGQQAVNSQIGRQIREPLAATWLNFAVGTAGLLALVGLTELGSFSGVQQGQGQSGPIQWWLLLGGLAGVGFITASIIAVRGLGVLVFSLFLITGQTTSALAIDLVLPTGDLSVGIYLGVAVALTLAASALALVAPRQR